MQGPPLFLVRDQQGNLHAYYRKDLLLIDLHLHVDDPPKQVFVLAQNTLTISYYPLNLADLLEPVASLEQLPRPATSLALNA
jgi:hypothetical protein